MTDTCRTCRWCGSDTEECLYTETHDLPPDEEHAPCGAFIPADEHETKETT